MKASMGLRLFGARSGFGAFGRIVVLGLMVGALAVGCSDSDDDATADEQGAAGEETASGTESTESGESANTEDPDAGEGTEAGDDDGSSTGEEGGNDFDTIEIDIPQTPLCPPSKADAEFDPPLFADNKFVTDVDFDSLVDATYVAANGEDPPLLQFIFSKGTNQLEIQVGGAAEDFEQSINSDAPPADLQVNFLFNDGSLAQVEGGPQFKWAANAWELNVDENQGQGGQIIGTFSCTLSKLVADDNPDTDTITITNGTFSANYGDPVDCIN